MGTDDGPVKACPRRPVWEISTAMDAAVHYRHLLTLGRDEFLAVAAPAMLVRYRTNDLGPVALRAPAPHQDAGETVDDTLSRGNFSEKATEMELYPLAKKPGASFPDRITIGRTSNNDVVIAEPSVSRLHAYVRQAGGWRVADAGSKNGSSVNGIDLEARREAVLPPGAVLRIGDVHLTFYRSSDLFDLHGGDHGRR
jgi:hypothetical protein